MTTKYFLWKQNRRDDWEKYGKQVADRCGNTLKSTGISYVNQPPPPTPYHAQCFRRSMWILRELCCLMSSRCETPHMMHPCPLRTCPSPLTKCSRRICWQWNTPCDERIKSALRCPKMQDTTLDNIYLPLAPPLPPRIILSGQQNTYTPSNPPWKSVLRCRQDARHHPWQWSGLAAKDVTHRQYTMCNVPRCDVRHRPVPFTVYTVKLHSGQLSLFNELYNLSILEPLILTLGLWMLCTRFGMDGQGIFICGLVLCPFNIKHLLAFVQVWHYGNS